MEPESLLVGEGRASVKGIDGDERIIEQGEVAFFNARDCYQITNVGTGRLLLYRNHPEAFGGAHVTAKQSPEPMLQEDPLAAPAGRGPFLHCGNLTGNPREILPLHRSA